MNPTHIGILALLLVVASGILWFRAAMAVRLPENRSAFVATWIGGAILAIASLASGAEGWTLIPAVLALVAAVFFLFTVAISRQEVEDHAIAVGGSLPDFSALDEDGQTFDSADLAGRPVLLKFFRGHW